jgi:hypothetical protein
LISLERLWAEPDLPIENSPIFLSDNGPKDGCANEYSILDYGKGLDNAMAMKV